MSFAQASIKAIAQAPPPAIVLASAVALFVAAGPLGHLVERQIEASFAPRYILVPIPAETPRPTPSATPDPAPSPIASATPRPTPAPDRPADDSAGGTKRPEAPAPTPTAIAGAASPPFAVVPAPITRAPSDPMARPLAPVDPASAPPVERPSHDRPPHRIPRPAPERVRPPIFREAPREIGGEGLPSREPPREFIPRKVGGFGFPLRYGSPFGGGFPFMRGPMQGGFRPRMPFGGFGHFHLF